MKPFGKKPMLAARISRMKLLDDFLGLKVEPSRLIRLRAMSCPEACPLPTPTSISLPSANSVFYHGVKADCTRLISSLVNVLGQLVGICVLLFKKADPVNVHAMRGRPRLQLK